MTNKEIAKKTVDRMLDIINSNGYLPWTKPWSKGAACTTTEVIDGYTVIRIPVKHWSRAGRPYQGINNMLLAMEGKTGEMITFNQCKAEGGKIKKGAKAATVVYWNMIVKKEDEIDDNGNPVLNDDGSVKQKTVKIPVLKEYKVFSVDQDCEGIKTKHHPGPIEIRVPQTHVEAVDGCKVDDQVQAAEDVIASYISRSNGLKLERSGISNRAYYRPSAHMVVVPNVVQFHAIAEYYSTMFHELGHSTGHSSLLNRFGENGAAAAFGDETYSREELVAEITAATILNELGLESGNSFRNSAAYVKSWSEHIKNDPMMFVTAASRAEKAIALILNQA